MLRAFLITFSLVIAGCCSGIGLGFSPDPASGKNRQHAYAWITGSPTETSNDPHFEDLTKDAQLQGALIGSCVPSPGGVKPEFFGPAAVPILVALSSLAFDLYIDKRKSDLDKLKSEAQQSTDIELVLGAEKFRDARCIIIERQAKGDTDAPPPGDAGPGLVVVLLIKKTEANSDYFKLKPIFVRARNSIAKTAASTGTIAVTSAVAIKQVATVQGVTTLAQVGQAATTIDAVNLIGDVKCSDGKCDESPIIPLPKGNGSVAVGLSVLESGDVGFSIDRAQAELDAIKSALGPAVGATVQGHFDREFGK